MLSFLKITIPYSIDPDEMAFAVHGTGSHAMIEAKAKELGIPTELSATDDGRNAIDLVQYEDGVLTLIDTKTWGSFRVAKALGISQTSRMPDPSGECYKTSGKWGKAGSPKMVPVFTQDPNKADNWDTEMQLNRYRIMLEDTGIHVDAMAVHAIVRDGGIKMSRERGITRNTYMIPVQRLEDDYVREYFDIKQEELQIALEQGSWDIPCTERECWDGQRCRSYCPVAQYCVKGQMLVNR